MYKMQDIVGLPLLETETGRKIGLVKDIVLSMDDARVHGFTIEESEFKSDKGILFTELLSFGRDAIMIRNHHVLQKTDSLFKVEDIYYTRNLFEKEIITEDGLRLGILMDIFFDTTTGEMKWYQISDSIVTDLLYGRMIIPLPKAQIIGEYRVIIPQISSKFSCNEIQIE